MGVINIKTLEINSQPFVLFNDIEQGLVRGSIWENLFSPYKYVVEKITNTNEEQKVLLMLQVYTFVATELVLFICTHPDSKEAIEMLKKVNIEKKKMTEYIDSKFQPICSNSVIFDGYIPRKSTWEVR